MNNVSEAKLRPFDATRCKPGDPVMRRDGTRGEFLSYEPRACRFHVASVLWQNGWVGLYSAAGEHPDFPDPIIGLPPLPIMVPLEQSDIVLGKTVVRKEAGEGYLVTAALPTALCVGGERPLFVSWDCLQRESWEISFDHGVTWQKAGGVK